MTTIIFFRTKLYYNYIVDVHLTKTNIGYMYNNDTCDMVNNMMLLFDTIQYDIIIVK